MGDIEQKPFFCWLLTTKKLIEKQKINTLIGTSQNPYHSWKHYNSSEYNNKKTKFAIGKWKLSMIIGPFTTQTEADDFSDIWKRESRGKNPRLEKGIELAKLHEKQCFDKRKKRE